MSSTNGRGNGDNGSTKGSGNSGSSNSSGKTCLTGDDLNLSGLQTLSDMFDYSRLSPSVRCSLSAIPHVCVLVLYLPLGLLLVPLRLLLLLFTGILATFQCSSFCLPRKLHTVLLRIELLVFFGVWISVKGKPAADCPLWVANHISEADAVVLRAISDPYILGYAFYKDLWWLKLTPIRLFKMIYVPTKSRSEGNAAGRDEMNRIIRETLTPSLQSQQSPQSQQGKGRQSGSGERLLLFPEGGLTNGRVGLLQYHKFVFSLGLPVQPIALSLWSPLPLQVDHMYASALHNALWFLFVPFQIYTIEFLSSVSINQEGGETPLAFSRRVMHNTADHLHIQASPFLYSDKKKWGTLRRSLTKEGYRFNIVVDELNNSVKVVNTVTPRKQKKSQVQPVVTSMTEEGSKVEVKVAGGISEASDSSRDVLLRGLYEAWEMTQESFSHLLFTPVTDPTKINTQSNHRTAAATDVTSQ